MQRLIMLILLPISAVLTACAQNSLTLTCNALQEDSLVRRTYSLCEQSFEGENIVWDFRMLNEIPCKSHHLNIAQFTNSYLWDENGILANYVLIGDTLFLHRVESPLYSMDYSLPIVEMVYPFSYGKENVSEFEGRGLYENRLLLSEKGVCQVEADAFGKILYSDDDTLNNVLRVCVQYDSDIDISSKYSDEKLESLHKRTEIYRWYARGFRYPIIESVAKKITKKDNLLYSQGYTNVFSIDDLDLNKDEENKKIREQDSIIALNSHPIENMNVTKNGNQVDVVFSTNTDVDVSVVLTDVLGVVYYTQKVFSKRENENICTIPIGNLHRGQYVVYLNVDGMSANRKFNVE